MAQERGPSAEQFLAEAALLLTQSLDYEATIRRLAQLAVPTFADWCLVDLISDDGHGFERVAVGHHLPGSEPLAAYLKRRYALRPEHPVGVASAMLECRPLLLREIGEELPVALARDDEHLKAIRAMRMRSAVIAPLLVRGKAIGALSLIACDRNFGESELWFVTQLGNSAAVAIDNARLYAAERRARLKVTKLQEVTAALSRASTPEEVAEAACQIGTEAMEAQSGALWLAQGDGALRLAGSRGVPPAFMDPFRLIAAGAPGVPAMEVLRSGEAIWVETEADYQRVAPDFFETALAANQVAAYGAMPISVNGRVSGVMVFGHAINHSYDATDRAFYGALAQHCSQALERAWLLESERRSNVRLRLLVQVGETLSQSLDLDETLRALAKVVVPALADWCVVDLVDGSAIRRVATEHQDPEKVRIALERALRYQPKVGDGSPIANVIAGGKSRFHARVPVELLKAAARDEQELDRFQQEQIVSVIVVPLTARGNCIGALSLTTSASGRTYEAADVVFAEELGRRAGLAIANARMHREVEASHERMRTLFLQAPMAIAIYRGRELRIEFANSTFLQVRARGADIIGRTYAEAFPETVETAQVLYDTALISDEPLTYPEVRTFLDRGRGPEEAFFHVSFVGLKNDLGEVDRLMSVSIEITDRVLALRALDLEKSEIESARRAAEAANRAKDEFLAMLGHELRNPLAPILTALNLLDLRGVTGSDKELGVITRQVHHLTRLVDDLLDVSRITSGKVSLVREPIELASIVLRAVEMASPLFEQRDLHLQVEVAPLGLMVNVDARRMAQAFSNLLTNAAKYTNPGGRVSITARRVSDEIVVQISDDGVGIRPEMLGLIFDLFVQEPQALDRARGGLGLGLAIVKSLVTMHGGSVTAESGGIGTGSSFFVRLPVTSLVPTTHPSRLEEAPLPRPVLKTRPQRILVVDDNEDAAQLLALGLKGAGHITLTAADGHRALLSLQEFHPDVAILDIGLPVMDGYELAGRIRLLLPHVRLIALTGYGQESDKGRAHEAGFHQHLVKPVELRHLLAEIGEKATEASSAPK